jgi:hypothetical protein
MMTLSALKDHMPQLTRATPLNRAEHFTLLVCGLLIELQKKRVAMLPQTVGDCRHRSLRILTNPVTSPAQRLRRLRVAFDVADGTAR